MQNAKTDKRLSPARRAKLLKDPSVKHLLKAANNSDYSLIDQLYTTDDEQQANIYIYGSGSGEEEDKEFEREDRDRAEYIDQKDQDMKLRELIRIKKMYEAQDLFSQVKDLNHDKAALRGTV